MILAAPSYGMSRSVTTHNVKLDVVCDWLEGSALFSEEPELSAADAVDVLCEEQIYDDQDLAWDLLQNALRQIRRRQSWLGAGPPIEVRRSALVRRGGWRDWAGLSFCLALSFSRWYPDWRANAPGDYEEQGRLFEDLSLESARALFPQWEVCVVGWRPSQPRGIGEIAEDVACRLCEEGGDAKVWAGRAAKDAGLDLLCYLPFGDGRPSLPAYLFQCASGANWEDKVHDLDLNLWRNIVRFGSNPRKGFAMPYALLDDDFRRVYVKVDGIVLDRYRLLSSGGRGEAWLSDALRQELISWLDGRLSCLPSAE